MLINKHLKNKLCAHLFHQFYVLHASLKQVGPYTFLENHHKVNITFNPNATVDFYQIKSWEFRPELSGGSLEDEIYTPNMIAIAAAESTRWPEALAKDDFPFLRYLYLYRETSTSALSTLLRSHAVSTP